MNDKNFTSGEYVKKKEVINYLKILDWHMSREELIKRINDIPSINLTEQDIK